MMNTTRFIFRWQLLFKTNTLNACSRTRPRFYSKLADKSLTAKVTISSSSSSEFAPSKSSSFLRGKSRWSIEELEKLKKLKSDRSLSWDDIATRISNRSADECRDLWIDITKTPLTQAQKATIHIPNHVDKIENLERLSANLNANVDNVYRTPAHQIVGDDGPPSSSNESHEMENDRRTDISDTRKLTSDQSRLLLELEREHAGCWDSISSAFTQKTSLQYSPQTCWEKWSKIFANQYPSCKRVVWPLPTTLKLLKSVVGKPHINWAQVSTDCGRKHNVIKYHLEFIRCCSEIWSLEAVFDLLTSVQHHGITSEAQWQRIESDMRSHKKTCDSCQSKYLAIMKTSASTGTRTRREHVNVEDDDGYTFQEDSHVNLSNDPTKTCMKERRKTGIWSEDDRKLLRNLVQEYEQRKVSIEWTNVGQRLNRSKADCWRRYYRFDNPKIKKGPFTPEEDFQLRMLVKRFGVGRWALLARAWNNGRTDEMCRFRWNKLNKLDKQKNQ